MGKLETFKTVVICILSLVVVGLAITLCLIKPEVITKTETVVKVDTVETIVYKEVPKEKIKYVHSHTIDTIYLKEPVDQIAIEQKHYSDSLSDIYISGYQPNIDSINYHIPERVVYIDKTVEIEKQQTEPWYKNRFIISAGFSAQYGLVHKQWDVGPYIGLGIRLY
jgi:hypothetical protein